MQFVVGLSSDGAEGQIELLKCGKEGEFAGVGFEFCDGIESQGQDFEGGRKIVEVMDLVVVEVEFLDVCVGGVVEKGQVFEVVVLQGQLAKRLDGVQVY